MHHLPALQISEEIQHPNLCRVIAAYREASRYFIIMKLCTGAYATRPSGTRARGADTGTTRVAAGAHRLAAAGGELFERLEKVNHFTESQASNMTKKLVSALQVRLCGGCAAAGTGWCHAVHLRAPAGPGSDHGVAVRCVLGWLCPHSLRPYTTRTSSTEI